MGVPAKVNSATSLASGSLAIVIWYLIERLLLGDLGLKEVADDLLWLVRPLYGDLDDLVEGGLHAVEPQLAHGGEDLLAFHHTALLRVS